MHYIKFFKLKIFCDSVIEMPKMRKVEQFFIITILVIFFSNLCFASYSYQLKKTIKLYRLLKTSKIKDKQDFSSIIIQKFYEIYSRSKSRKDQAFAMFMIGRTYYYLANNEKTGNEVFADLTISSFYRVIREFPESSLCDDAKYYVAKILYYDKNDPKRALEELYELIDNYPHGDYIIKAKKFIKLILKQNPKLRRKLRKKIIVYKRKLIQIRDLVGNDFFRLVFDFNKAPNYKIEKYEFGLKITLYKTSLSKKFKINNLNNNTFNENISFDNDKSKLIINITTGKIISLRYFVLTNPHRLVVDVEFEKVFIRKPHKKIQTIVIDPGHGGKDPGALYYGLAEKTVTLKIAKLLKKELQRRLPRGKYKIYLTRNNDRYLYLEDRVKFANELNADLFISIHCNASKDRNLMGFQTFYLNSNRDRIKICSTNEVQAIIDDLMKMARYSESMKLAEDVQMNLLKYLRRRYKLIENHGVKRAPFYVLTGTRMPAILVEVSFISNPLENRRLRSMRYLKDVSIGIAKGIIQYIRNVEFVKN